jgi:basic membrane protein A
MKEIKLNLVLALTVIVLVMSACARQPTTVEEPAAEEGVAVEEAPEVDEADSSPTGEPLRVAFVLPGVINDGGFNTQAYQAILAAEEALNLETTFVEGMSAPTDGAKAIRDYAAEDWDVVWAQGGQFASVVLEIAPDFPDTTFVTLASPGLEIPDNVWISGNEFDSAYFLAGALAGLMTESNTIGYVGGIEIPVYVATGNSFTAGAQNTNSDAEVLVTFTGNFNDPTAAREATAGQIQSGADIIAHVQDLGFFGVVEAVHASEADVRIIGKDTDQKSQAPDLILTSVIIDFGQQMQRILSRVVAGESGGYLPMSLEEGTLYLAPFYGEVPDDVIAQIEQLEEQILAGEIDPTPGENQ